MKVQNGASPINVATNRNLGSASYSSKQQQKVTTSGVLGRQGDARPSTPPALRAEGRKGAENTPSLNRGTETHPTLGSRGSANASRRSVAQNGAKGGDEESDARSADTPSSLSLSVMRGFEAGTKEGLSRGGVDSPRPIQAEMSASKLAGLRTVEGGQGEILRERSVTLSLDNGVSMRLWTQSGGVAFKVQRAGDVSSSDLKALEYRLQSAGQNARRQEPNDEVFE